MQLIKVSILVLVQIGISALPCRGSDPIAEREILQLEKGIMSQRQSIRSMELSITYVRKIHSSKDGKKEIKNRHDFVIDGNKKTEDTTYNLSTETPTRNLACYNCLGDKQYFHFWHTKGRPLTTAVFSKMKESDPENAAWRISLNPLDIGLVTHGYATAAVSKQTRVIVGENRTGLCAVRESVKDKPMIRVTWQRNKEVEVRYWIDPAQGNNIVALENVNQTQKSRLRTEIQLKWFESEQVWFPTCEKILTFEDDQFVMEERSDIDIRSINKEIDPTRFEIPGFRLPKGTIIREIPPHLVTREWDGSSLIEVKK